MKTKISFITILLVLGLHILQAQIKRQVAFSQNTVEIIKTNGFDRIVHDENHSISEAGSPELPVVMKSYLIPVDASKVTVRINSLSKQKIKGQYTLYPAQPPVPSGNIETFVIEPNPKIYESEAPFPGKFAEIISDEFYLGYRIVTVQLYPFEYFPKKKELYMCDIDFSIDYILTKSYKKEIIETQYQSLYRYELNKKAVKFRVDNPDAIENYDTKVQNIVQGKAIVYNALKASAIDRGLRSQPISVLDEQILEYIIITCDSLKSSFLPLANWKTKKGVYTFIKTVEEIELSQQGNDLQEKIRNYIIKSRQQWGNGLYILLGGSVNIIPARMVNGVFINRASNHTLTYPTDMYYATYVNSWNNNSNNKFNEYQYITNSNGNFSSSIDLDLANYDLGVILGRILANNVEEANIWVNKVITYEKANNIENINYFNNNLYSNAYMDYDGTTLGNFSMNTIKNNPE
jgi:hypothetical protein